MIILAMITMVALLVGIGQIYVTGVDGPRLKSTETCRLLAEMAVVFLCFFVCLRKAGAPGVRVLSGAAITAVFCWLHVVFLPMVCSGLYLLLIIAAGSRLRVLIDRGRAFQDFHMLTVMTDFLLGSSFLILLFCVMSLLGIGSIGCTRAAAGLLGGFCLVSGFRRDPGEGQAVSVSRLKEYFGAGHGTLRWSTVFFLSLILTMLMLQAGRMNLCADYDSLHYGLRSEYVLNNGGGIYENLGSINVVYTYSKGLEILLLPISGLPSYSFFISFQLWATAGILLAAGEIIKLFASRRYALFGMALLSCIPGVMNMGITAKTDSLTAFFQLLMIYYLLLYLKKNRDCYMPLAVCAFLMTMVLKPTALVFSTVAASTAAVCVFAAGRRPFCLRDRYWLAVPPTICMWILVWLRTYLLTGLPVTSVFYSIWARLGFEVRYPFHFEGLPSNGGSPFSLSGLKHFVRRLYGVLLAPVGEDMAHVRIAWGSALLLIFLAILLLPLFADMAEVKKKEKYPLLCLAAVFLTNGAVSLAALYLLWQVDGNYFILLYALFTILAVITVSRLKNWMLSHAVVKLLMPVLLFNITMTAVSNWSGALGLSPVSVLHAGYQDHDAEVREQMEAQGNNVIWDMLAEDPKTRVLVFGEQPRMLLFPCNAQSYTDIEGSGGNVYISASPEALVCFLAYAGTDYIYLESGYLKPGTDAWNNVTEMVKKGYMGDILYENGNALASFCPEPGTQEGAEERLGEFAQKYWPGEQQ